MDLNKLTIGDRVVAISAILFLIFMFFPWYGFDESGVSGNDNGFEYFLAGWLPLLLAIVMVVQIAITRFGSTALPRPGPLTWGQVHLAAGALAAVILLLRVLIPSDIDNVFGGDFELDRKFGVFLAFLATLGLAAGGFLKTQEPETAGPPRGGPAGGPPPPPPPPSAPPPPPPTA